MLIWSVRLIMLICLVPIACVIRPTPAAACSTVVPTLGPRIVYTPAERTRAAMIVFEGTVIERHGNPYDGLAVIEVARYFKGHGPSHLQIAGIARGCGTGPIVGAHRIFFATGDPETQLQAFSLSVDDPIDEDADIPQLVDEVRAATGQVPQAPSPALVWLPPPVSQLVSQQLFRFGMLLVLTLVIAIGVRIWMGRRRYP